MSKKVEVLKKEHKDIWQWAGTRKSALNCSENLIEEMINVSKEQFEEMGEELLDVHVFRYEPRVFPFVTIEFLLRKKKE
ncbi:hypothetical protein ACFVAD_20835 [Sutcliffiella sp. NPDC057660]|uniref:hypothetical protein n=1 Tax=Sutcliffiella sp. NPDC057660 TaxID=3346199 RepID=UPI003674D4C3